MTGHTTDEEVNASGDVRLDNPGWVLPNKDDYQLYPAARYTPSYNKDVTVTVDGVSGFNVVNPSDPCQRLQLFNGSG